MQKNSKIYIAGHNGMVGSAIVRKLQSEGYDNLLVRSSKEVDLRNQQATQDFLEAERPEYIFLAAARVGGILANSEYSGDFIYENLAIETNVLHMAKQIGVKKLLFLGSSCIYPKIVPQPIKEEYLLTGDLEETNRAYAVAKIAGIVMSQSYNKQYGTNFISLMPTNLYGPNDNFDYNTSHVLPALLRKAHEARVANAPSFIVWGDGTPRREFLHVDDLADAALHLMRHYESSEIINVGAGIDVSILELADIIKKVVGFEGEVVYDNSKPNGTPQKLLDVSRLHASGWQHKIQLKEGMASVYAWYLKHEQKQKFQ